MTEGIIETNEDGENQVFLVTLRYFITARGGIQRTTG